MALKRNEVKAESSRRRVRDEMFRDQIKRFIASCKHRHTHTHTNRHIYTHTLGFKYTVISLKFCLCLSVCVSVFNLHILL